jgi:hypothetical protein
MSRTATAAREVLELERLRESFEQPLAAAEHDRCDDRMSGQTARS